MICSPLLSRLIFTVIACILAVVSAGVAVAEEMSGLNDTFSSGITPVLGSPFCSINLIADTPPRIDVRCGESGHTLIRPNSTIPIRDLCVYIGGWMNEAGYSLAAVSDGRLMNEDVLQITLFFEKD